MTTGWIAFRLGIAAYIVPFMFIYGPSLLFIGHPLTILITLGTASIGVLALAAGVQGWWYAQIMPHERALLLFSALLLIHPGIYTDLIGLGALGVVYFLQRNRRGAASALSPP